MNSFNVVDLKEDMYFSKDVVLDKSFLLLNNCLPVNKKLMKALLDWEFRTIFSEGTNGPASSADTGATTNVQIEERNAKISESLQNALSAVEQYQSTESTQQNDNDRLKLVQKVYTEYLQYIESIYTHFATHKELNLDEISDAVKDLCKFVKDNRRYVLRIQPSVMDRKRNFLVIHSMRSTILSITIGMQLRLQQPKLIELGVSSILHEIGMIRLPPQLYITNKMLSPAEKTKLFSHPIISYNILKGFSFPLSICLGVLEHHEKENGLGYPRKIKGEKISLFAKIISVACSFEAITAPREHKEALDSYNAMLEMLKNTGNQYDDTVIKALLYSLSLYPIGAYVYLSDGKLAQVVDVNPENPKNPIVQLCNDENKSLIQTNDSDMKIARVLTKTEIIDLINTNIINFPDVKADTPEDDDIEEI